jgi:hypothetical protein
LSSADAHDAKFEPPRRIADKNGKSAGILRLKRAMEIDRMRRKTYSQALGAFAGF